MPELNQPKYIDIHLHNNSILTKIKLLLQLLPVRSKFKTPNKSNSQTIPQTMTTHSKNQNSKSQNTNIDKYLLKDYSFLQDYIVVQNKLDNSPIKLLSNNQININGFQQNGQEFIAQIMGTQQIVKFTKIGYEQRLMQRFQALAELHEQGVILADNLFILEEAAQYYFYIIQAFIPDSFPYSPQMTQNCHRALKTPIKQKNKNSNNISELSSIANEEQTVRFTNLHNYINSEQYVDKSMIEKIQIIDKIKILLECVHQNGQTYMGLTPYRIIIDLQQQQNIYLAPFSLTPHIFTHDRQISSYTSPQFLQMQLQVVDSQQMKVTQQMMIKNDIWALGCILLQILFYCSPAFYAMTNYNQIKIIKEFEGLCNDNDGKIAMPHANYQCSLQACIHILNIGQSTQNQLNKLTLVSNLIQNTLQFNPQQRILSCQNNQLTRFSLVNKQITLNYKNRGSITSQNKIIDDKNQIQQTANFGNSELILNFLYLSKIHIKKELRINVYLDKRYSFFISSSSHQNPSSPSEQNPIYSINKTLKLTNDFQFLQQLLQTPILCQLCEDTSITKIHINLSTLVLTIDGKRAWNKPIIGSYSSANTNKQYQQCTIIKIKSQLIWKIQPDTMKYCIRRNQCEELQKEKENLIKTQKQSKTDKQNKQNKQIKHPSEKQLKANNNQSPNQNPQKKTYFDSINANLQQICNKWKNNDLIKLNQSNPSDENNHITNKDQQIAHKIKQIMNKFNIVNI